MQLVVILVLTKISMEPPPSSYSGSNCSSDCWKKRIFSKRNLISNPSTNITLVWVTEPRGQLGIGNIAETRCLSWKFFSYRFESRYSATRTAVLRKTGNFRHHYETKVSVKFEKITSHIPLCQNMEKKIIKKLKIPSVISMKIIFSSPFRSSGTRIETKNRK